MDEFTAEDYLCLVLPGCSDFTEVFRDQKINEFLKSFQGNSSFPIGAICGGPILLARAGLLKDKKFTASIYMDFFDFCPFLDKTNYVAAPIVVSDNIVTAGGSNFNGFAVAMALYLDLNAQIKFLAGTWIHGYQTITNNICPAKQ